MVRNIETKNVSHHGLDLLHPGITELEHLTAVLANEVVVLLVGIRLFEQGHVLAELMPCDQVTGEQVLDRVVDGGPAHLRLFLLHVEIKRIDVEMIIERIYLAQDGEPFGSPSEVLFLQVISEHLLDFGNHILSGGEWALCFHRAPESIRVTEMIPGSFSSLRISTLRCSVS